MKRMATSHSIGFIHGGEQRAVRARIERELRAELATRLQFAGRWERLWFERSAGDSRS